MGTSGLLAMHANSCHSCEMRIAQGSFACSDIGGRRILRQRAPRANRISEPIRGENRMVQPIRTNNPRACIRSFFASLLHVYPLTLENAERSNDKALNTLRYLCRSYSCLQSSLDLFTRYCVAPRTDGHPCDPARNLRAHRSQILAKSL
jgi:hypothetical protein